MNFKHLHHRFTMRTRNEQTRPGRRPRRQWFYVEQLERRALLTTVTETFNGPSLNYLIQEAYRGKNTAPAAIQTMVSALKTQLTSGPLADLNSGAVDGNGLVTEVQSLEASYETNADAQLAPRFPNVDYLIKQQGQRVVADIIALNAQNAAGLITTTELATEAASAINSLTTGMTYSYPTPLSSYAAPTQTFENNLKTISNSLTASTPTTPAQASAMGVSLAEAYRASIHAGLQVVHPNISSSVDVAVNNLEGALLTIGTLTDAATAQTQFNSAITAFDNAILDTTGLFGPGGAVSRATAAGKTVPQNLSVTQSDSTISGVSGTASGGLATLTATLTLGTNPQGLSGRLVTFTVDGAFAGAALTDSNGIATLSKVPTSNATGTYTGVVVASFAGDYYNRSAHADGDLTVNQPAQTATTLSAVSGSASFGGTAILTAKLTDTSSGTGLAGKTVAFTLNGTSVGSATTDSSGVATLTGVATSAAVGTSTGAVVASFAGDSSNAAAADTTGDLVVSKANSTLASVSGSASFGGTATLTATLTSQVTGLGIAGETVTFTLNGTPVGNATTDSNGVATLTNVATSASVGTSTGAVVASFAGTADYNAASDSTGDLTVTAAATTLASAAGTASFGGTATLTATLTSQVTSLPLQGETVAFTLNGTSVGTAVTDSNGVATLTNVATSAAVGTSAGAVVASYAGSVSYTAATNATGDLVVSPADTTVTSIAATASFGGTATFVATLKSSVTNLPIPGETVDFTLNGTSVGQATTDANGIATLSNITIAQGGGTYTGIVGASYSATTDYNASTGTGDLVVNQANTALSSVSGSATGGLATLVATLTSSVTSLPIAGQMVSFTLDGTTVGQVTTDGSGVATLTGIPTSDSSGTHTAVVVASYGGTTDYNAASDVSGDLTVA